jgi:hypothetical protein
MTPARAATGVALLVLAAVGLVLVLTGGGDGGEPADGGAATTSAAQRPRSTLPLDDLTVAGVEQLSGLAIPDDAADFLTAKLSENRQLDVTFTMGPEDVEAFAAGSGLPPLAPDARVILHSSPLWKLNPGGPIRGAADVRDGINRAVELVDENGRVRARISLRAI